MTGTSAAQNVTRAKTAAIMAAFIGLAAGWPSSFGSTSTAFIVPLTHEFGWTRTVPSLMYMCSMSGMALASLNLGRTIERFGAGAVAAVSGICLMIVMLLLSIQSGSVPMALALAFLAGSLGSGTGVGLYLSVLPRWFDYDLGRALGLSIVGQSAGLTMMPALAAVVINAHGWRSGYVALAGAQIVLTLVAAAILIWLRRAGPPIDASRLEKAAVLSSPAEVVASPVFWLLSGMIFLVTFGIYGATIHLFPIYIDHGIAPNFLPLVAIALGVGTLVGRVGSGFLLDHLEARLVALASFAIGALGIGWLATLGHADGSISIYVAPLLIGAALGAESDILAYMVRSYFGSPHYATTYNRALIGYYLGALSGPVALGWASVHFADVRLGLSVLAACCVAAMGVTFLLPSTRSPLAR